jgi:hypothetical protein
MTDLTEKLYSREKILKDLFSSNAELVVECLLSLAHFDNDWKWSQEQCIKFAKSDNESVRGIAMLCFGHIARIHRNLNIGIVKPILYQGLKDESLFVRGHAQNALDDLEIFLEK